MVRLRKHRHKPRRLYLWQIKERIQAQIIAIKRHLKETRLELLEIVRLLRNK